MRTPFPRHALVGVVILGGAWVACVGEDPGVRGTSGERAVGDRLGPCFPDGKCKQGLICRDGEICLAPDEPTPPRLDGGLRPPDDGGLDARPPFDGSVDAGAICVAPMPGPGPRCSGASCGAAQACCLIGDEPMCATMAEPKCQSSTARWGCDSDDQCGSNACCYLGTSGVSVRCPSAMTAVTSSCMPPNDCASNGGVRGCSTSADCPANKACGPMEMMTKLGFSVIVKACR